MKGSRGEEVCGSKPERRGPQPQVRAGILRATQPGARHMSDDLRADRFATYFTEVRGFRQAYVREGVGGTPVLLVHGWPETKRIWWRNIQPLASAGFEVIAPDLRGFGESDVGPDGFHDVDSHARDLYALVH